MKKYSYAALLCLPLFFVGCTKTESGLVGCGIGTAAGAGIGYAIDGGAGGAILGGVLGAIGGGAVGSMTNKEDEYASSTTSVPSQQLPQETIIYTQAPLQQQIRQEQYNLEQEKIDWRKQELENKRLELEKRKLDLQEKELRRQELEMELKARQGA